MISNAEYGGALHVSDHRFESEGQTMKSVYVRAEVEGETPNVRQLWQIREQGDEKFHVVSM